MDNRTSNSGNRDVLCSLDAPGPGDLEISICHFETDNVLQFIGILMDPNGGESVADALKLRPDRKRSEIRRDRSFVSVWIAGLSTPGQARVLEFRYYQFN